ncbi:hypothetical protein M427DRAFT_52560 [Gonapodya prolifera JEL478]|uniref:Uncharacterized protein n=1 Tax=Gonapodya prolifera (strain JEL478) TaxID=1344416 RepID=A0A139ASC2_GONPJ|nr:hypothetical protein M427DRAFT_52560 [Gonapodya prolifera JEL478]|eukprot:KXS19656.1 hypothetical protein M427DRAFT_52560 [Gonapodya prolifera JEL478]
MGCETNAATSDSVEIMDNAAGGPSLVAEPFSNPKKLTTQQIISAINASVSAAQKHEQRMAGNRQLTLYLVCSKRRIHNVPNENGRTKVAVTLSSCGFAATAGLMHSPRPCLRSSTWSASVPSDMFPRLIDAGACRNALGDGRDDGGLPAAGTPVSSASNTPTVTRTEGGFSVHFSMGACTPAIHVFDTIPLQTWIPPLPPSLAPTPGGLPALQQNASRLDVDSILAASFVDKLGYHVNFGHLQAQVHEWFAAVEDFECGVGWVLKG